MVLPSQPDLSRVRSELPQQVLSSGSGFFHRLLARLLESRIACVRIAGLLTALIGILVLTDYSLPRSLLQNMATILGAMKANTALGFMAAGISLALLAKAERRSWATYSGLALAALVFGIGLLTLFQDLFQNSIGIDQLLFHDWDKSVPFPGRMAPLTALNFILIGYALLMLGLKSPITAQSLSLLAAATALVHLLGYLFTKNGPVFLTSSTQMALHTSIGFLLLSAGVLLARPYDGLIKVATSRGLGGDIARRLLPMAFFVPIGLGWLRLKGQMAGLYNMESGVALYAVVHVAVFTAIIWWNARIAQATDEARQRSSEEQRVAEAEVRRLNTELEQHVAQRTAQLQAAVKELEAFSYSVSHDLRTPLRGIDGYSRILLEDYEDQLDDEGRRYLNLVRSHTQQMGQLIDDLLAFSRLNRHDIRKQEVHPNNIIQRCLEDMRLELEGRDIEWRIAELPPCHADPVLLKQVYMNLLGNAVKFTRRCEKAVIEVGYRQDNGETVYFVKDNGAGFDMRYVDKLFTVFQRLHRADEFEGTGVGLANVQRIVHRHGGWVRAEGAVGKGATISFTMEGEVHHE